MKKIKNTFFPTKKASVERQSSVELALGGGERRHEAEHETGHMTLSCPSLPPQSSSAPSPSRRRQNVLAELVDTEQRYVAALRHMLDGYKQPLSGVLTEQQLTAVFSISDLIYDFHTAMAAGLRQCVEQPFGDALVGSYMLQMVSFLRSYSLYVNNYTLAVSTLAALEEHDAKFAELLQTLRGSTTDDGEPLQSLYTYLVMPIQRVPRYLLLLERLGRCTEPGHPDSAAIQQAIKIIAETATYIDEKRAAAESNQRMLVLSMAVHSVPAGFSVLASGRTLRHSSVLTMDEAGKSKRVRAFLLSDGLLLTKERRARPKSFSLPAGPMKRAVSVSSSAIESGAPLEPSTGHSLHYLDWLPFAQPADVVVVNHGDGRFAVGSALAGRCLHSLRGDTADKPPLIDRLCAALGRDTPPPTPIEERPPPRARRGSISSIALSLGSLVSHAAAAAGSSSSSANAAAASSSSPMVTERSDERAMSPRLAALVKRSCRQRTKSDPPGSAFAIRPKCSISVSGNACHDHATMVAAGFVDASALPLPQPALSWAEVESDQPDSGCGVALAPDYRYELGGRQLRPNLLLPPQFMYPELLGTFYQRQMADREHVVLFGNTPEQKDPVVVSVETVSANLPFRRAVVRSKHGETRTVVPPTRSLDECLAHLLHDCADVLVPPSPRTGPTRWLRLAPDAMPQTLLSPRDARNRWTLSERLVDYDAEQQRMFTKLKIGVVPTKPGDMQQRSDRRIFATSAPSPAFQEFLDFLGDTVPLRGYDGFAGGLDTTADMTGSHSLRAALDSDGHRFDIMFHVSTMLPHVDGDEQQLAKKRHIGNDLVVVVFHEDDQPFDPRVFISKMNQVFVVVTKVGTTDEQRPVYRLAYVCKDQAPSLPVLPVRPEFVADDAFRRFLLAKLVNAEATTHQTCLTFVARNRRARTSCLQEIIDIYTPIAVLEDI